MDNDLKLHSSGKKDYLSELKKEKEAQENSINKSKKSKSEKVHLIKKIWLKFSKQGKDSDHSLFLGLN